MRKALVTHGVRGVYTQGGYGRQERISTMTKTPPQCLHAGQHLPGGGVYAIDRPASRDAPKEVCHPRPWRRA